MSALKSRRTQSGGGLNQGSPTVPCQMTEATSQVEEAYIIPYDENLLERARNQWQFGDWESLAQLNRDILQHHPDRAKLALLAAAGHAQQGSFSSARQLTRLAQEWGCGAKLIRQIMIAGVHNSLGRAAEIIGQKTRALQHFESSVTIGTPGSDKRLLGQLRANMQISHAEIPNISSADILRSDKSVERNSADETRSRCSGRRFVDSYFIDDNYKCRDEYAHYDDMEVQDKWQLEIYLHAYALMKKNNFHRVADIGCGSAYKLITYLDEFITIGYELADNVEILKKRYPGRDWRISDFESEEKFDVDVVICSDVIEHLVDPDCLIKYLLRQNFKYLIFSTPDKNMVYASEQERLGPPRNPAHVREWNFYEFADYIGKYFYIIDHRITNIIQSTQMIVCKKYN